jgi:hypothetical protein
MLLGSYSTLIPSRSPFEFAQSALANQDGTDRDSISSDVSVGSLALSLGDATYIGKGRHPGDSQASLHTAHILLLGVKARSPTLEGERRRGDRVILRWPESFPIEVAKIFDILMALKQRPPQPILDSEVDFQPPSSTSRNIDYGYQ